MTAATASTTAFRFCPRVSVSLRKLWAVTVVPRSSHKATGRPVNILSFSANSSAARALSPWEPSIFSGCPTTNASAPNSLTLATISSASYSRLGCRMTVTGVANSSLLSQQASPVRTFPKSTAQIFIRPRTFFMEYSRQNGRVPIENYVPVIRNAETITSRFSKKTTRICHNFFAKPPHPFPNICYYCIHASEKICVFLRGKDFPQEAGDSSLGSMASRSAAKVKSWSPME